MNGIDGLQARTIGGGDNFGLMHNKGVIIDDTVWVSSINWSNAAFMSNREAAVEINSKDVADYYAGYFLRDWGGEYGMELIAEVSGNTAGEAVIFDASLSSFPPGTVFTWYFGGHERDGIKVAVILPEGVHECVLKAVGPDGGVYHHNFTVVVGASEKTSVPYLKYMPIIAIMLTILAYAVIRGMRERS
jgi:hypothetical protein